MELFAATSFGRIAMRRTSKSDAFSAPRMRTPRGPSRSLWSLHRIVSTSDVLVVTTGHTRVEILLARCAVHRRHVDIAAYRDRSGVDLLVRGPCFALKVSRQDGHKPENAFRCVQNPRAFTRGRRAGRNLFKFLSTLPHRFAFYPSAPVRQAVLRISFWLAPSLSHRPTLRSTGEEDARCVEPTSATHTNYVHPHLVRSQLAPLVTQRGRPPETKAPDDTIGGPSVSRHPRPLRRTVIAY
jgi:hypothetical protein